MGSIVTMEAKLERKPILCVDFDGVLHRYDSPWAGADVIKDPPVDGAMEWLDNIRHKFRIAIYSSRSKEPGGVEAMKRWLSTWLYEYLIEKRATRGNILLSDTLIRDTIMDDLEFPTQKPAAFLTIDDRAITFEGNFVGLEPEQLLKFKPWNKRNG